MFRVLQSFLCGKTNSNLLVCKKRNIVGLKGSAKKRAHFCTGTDKSTFVFTPGVTPPHPSAATAAAAAPTHPLTDRGDPWRPCAATDRADPRQRRGAGQPAASESPVRLQAGRPNHCHRRAPSAVNKSEQRGRGGLYQQQVWPLTQFFSVFFL